MATFFYCDDSAEKNSTQKGAMNVDFKVLI